MKKIISFIAITALLFACSKTDITSTEDSEVVATERAKGGNGNGNGGGGGGSGGGGGGSIVTTDAASYILPFGAISGGNVPSSGGGNNVTERGVCFSTDPNPTIDDEKVISGSGSGTFTSILSWLDEGTTYYVRAYANKIKHNNTTTYYGNEVSFDTPLPIYDTVDYNGFTYNTIEIGTQVWMVENLRTTKYRYGSDIPNVSGNSEWETTTTAAYCDYDNEPLNSDVYGRLYNSYAASNPLIAPEGWHVPSLAEFFTLTNYLGVEFAGGRMKEAGFTHWSSPNTGADNSSGFTAVGAGKRSNNGDFSSLGEKNNFWTSYTGYQLFLLDYDSGSYHYAEGTCSPDDFCHRYGASVRCVKD